MNWSILWVLPGLFWAVAAIVKTSQKYKLNKKEMELKILELEVEKQNGKVKMLEEENKKYDKIINNDE